MSAETALLTRTWQVGAYSVTMTVPHPKEGRPVFASVEWSPAEPRRLSSRELAVYRQGRNQALAELAEDLAISIAVLDL